MSTRDLRHQNRRAVPVTGIAGRCSILRLLFQSSDCIGSEKIALRAQDCIQIEIPDKSRLYLGLKIKTDSSCVVPSTFGFFSLFPAGTFCFFFVFSRGNLGFFLCFPREPCVFSFFLLRFLFGGRRRQGGGASSEEQAEEAVRWKQRCGNSQYE